MKKKGSLLLSLSLLLALLVLPAQAQYLDYPAYMGTWSNSNGSDLMDPTIDAISLEIYQCDGSSVSFDFSRSTWRGGNDLSFSATFPISGNVAQGPYVGDPGYGMPLHYGAATLTFSPQGLHLTLLRDSGDLEEDVDLLNPSFSPLDISDASISVLVNGSPISFDQPPVLANNRTLVPMRAVFEAMGVTVIWDQETGAILGMTQDKTVLIQQSQEKYSLPSGVYEMYIDDTLQSLDVPPQLINDRTLVPLRAVAEAFGADVQWHGDTQSVTIDGSIPAPQRLTPAQTAEIQSFSLQKAVETATAAGYSVVGTGDYWWGYRTGRKYFILPCGAGATTDAYGSIDTFWLYVYSDGTLSR